MSHRSPDCAVVAPAADHGDIQSRHWESTELTELTDRKQQQGCTGAAPISSSLHHHCSDVSNGCRTWLMRRGNRVLSQTAATGLWRSSFLGPWAMEQMFMLSATRISQVCSGAWPVLTRLEV